MSKQDKKVAGREEIKKRLVEAKQAAAEGKIVIANEAEREPGSVVVKSYLREGRDGECGVLIIDWSRAGIGFGQLTLCSKDGKLYADTECMDDEFVLEILAQALRERLAEPLVRTKTPLSEHASDVPNQRPYDPGSMLVKSYSREGQDGECGILVFQWFSINNACIEFAFSSKDDRLYANLPADNDQAEFVLEILAQALRERVEYG